LAALLLLALPALLVGGVEGDLTAANLLGEVRGVALDSFGLLHGTRRSTGRLRSLGG
jgi:hypothetical protein